MLDPRREAVLVRPRDGGAPDDKTAEVADYTRSADGRITVTYSGSGKTYTYAGSRVLVLTSPRRVPLPKGARVQVDRSIWESVTEAITFPASGGDWIRLFYARTDGTQNFRTYPSSRVRVVENAALMPGAQDVLTYLRSAVSRLPADDPLHHAYRTLDFIHPESALARYLARAPLERREPPHPLVFPFRRNLSQWDAVHHALGSSLSVIEGPPGTGKTETILNLLATIVAKDVGSVAVVSFNNAAVDNVREKLDEAGLGYLGAMLGNKDKQASFFAAQAARNASIAPLLQMVPVAPTVEGRLKELDDRLRGLYGRERERAELQRLLDAFCLEHEHFRQYLQGHDVPELEDLPLLRRSSIQILTFLAETQVEGTGYRPGLLRRIRRYFRYGSMRGFDAQDSAIVLRLQDAFYTKRISELRGQLDRIHDSLRGTDFAGLVEEHRDVSTQLLRSALQTRYQRQAPRCYQPQNLRRGSEFDRFIHDYPVLLSTCHSLHRSLPSGYLLDYLVIDEASQLDLVTAAPALACCRSAVVVGDLQQLAHIDTGAADNLDPPSPAYDYRRHSFLSSVIELYGADLPRTLLREHYRCDPTIIGFCNQMFYDGRLIPFTRRQSEQPMVVVPTARGNHMRRHRDGGRTNQRELDVILEEVIPQYCQGVAESQIGITTPYRRQVEKAADVLDRHETDTVHRFQGRQKRVVILSTVLDDTWRGRTGLPFVDDPRLVNVAVSRAAERFILVTDHGLLPTSRYLKDLIGYIRYQNPATPLPQSSVVSVFDLLYREYSDLLIPLAQRLKGGSAYRSENIIETVLRELFGEHRYAHLYPARQVLLVSLLSDLVGLTPEQQAYVRNRASIDFVIYNRVTNDPVLAIEVDGFAFHENNPRQLARDRLKDDILRRRGLPMLRLPTTGSGEEAKIRTALDNAEATPSTASLRASP